VFVFAVFSFPAFAQSFDVGGGFQFLRDQGTGGTPNFSGWFAQAAGNVTPVFGVLGEVAGGERTITGGGNVTLYSVMGGARLSAPRSAPVLPFAQLLFGVVRGSVSGGLFRPASGTQLAVQPAAGIDVKFTGNVGLRASGFYRRLGDHGKHLGLQVGLVVSGGAR
jgi:hypothetical protein